MGSVVLVLCIAFRSVRRGLVAATPTIMTLAVVYGVMGFGDVHLDLGTAMLASLVIGAGVDYAVHFASAWWNEPSIADAVRKTAAAIWTNATMVAAGFFILTLGEAKTLQNVGHLTAAAMLTAAVATFVCIPVFAGRSWEERS
jgi:predicted RND superfamily exporter protein